MPGNWPCWRAFARPRPRPSGLGPDGHTASLVPGDPVLAVTDRDVALTGIYQKRRRMTLTYPCSTGHAGSSGWRPVRKGGDAAPPPGRGSVHSGGSHPARRRPHSCGSGRHHLNPAPSKDSHENRNRHGPRRLPLKQEIASRLIAAGHELVDFRSQPGRSQRRLSGFVGSLRAGRGGGSRGGESPSVAAASGAMVCANKGPGPEARLIHDHFSARRGGGMTT